MNEIMWDVYLANEDMAGECLIGALHADLDSGQGGDYFRTVKEACEKRGISVAQALETYWKRQDEMLKLFTRSGQ